MSKLVQGDIGNFPWYYQAYFWDKAPHETQSFRPDRVDLIGEFPSKTKSSETLDEEHWEHEDLVEVEGDLEC
jgi:hypothetical protein